VRSRLLIVAGALVATVALGLVGGLVLFGGAGEEAPTSFTLAEPTTSSTVPPVAEDAVETTVAATTTTEAERATITVSFDETAPRLIPEIQALYAWIGDPDGNEPPSLPPGLTAHLAGIEVDEDLDLLADLHRSRIDDDNRVAVVTIDDDVVLAVADGSRWQIVGAKLTRFGVEPWYGTPVRHVMIIGTDARKNESQPALRADSLHIASSSLPERAGSIVGFPRDAYVSASYGQDKFTHVNARSGPDEVVTIASELSGLPIEGYILTGFQGFTNLVDAFGGVEVEVPFAMNDPKSKAVLNAGLQMLDGANALAFSRNRSIRGGDFTRSFHQGVLMQAGLQAVQLGGIEQLPGLVKILTTHTWTDLTTAQLLTLGAIAYELDPELIENLVLPGTVGNTTGGASVVFLDPEAEDVFADMADAVITVQSESTE
jgi:LCP family protein required for cell wall assembly